MIKLCSACQKIQTETELCDPCIDKLERVLAELPAQFDDLTAVATRQAAGPLGLGDNRNGRQWDGPFATGALGDGPWVYAPGAADQLWAFEHTVTAWATHIAAAHGYAIRFRGPGERFTVERTLRIWRNRVHTRVDVAVLPRSPQAPTAVAAARWLLAWLPAIRADPAAAQMVDELTALHAENHRWSVGHHGHAEFVGTCDADDVTVQFVDGVLTPVVVHCRGDLYAGEGKTDVRCGLCGRVHDAAMKRQATAAKLADQWATAKTIADALTTLDEPVKVETLRSWIKRDALITRRIKRTGEDAPRPLIVQVGVDDAGVALYRVGDVRERIGWSRQRARSERISA